MDKQEEKELLELFLGQAQEMVGILQTNIDNARQEAWKSAAHRFKGASGNLGATKLHHLCKRAEQHFTDEPARKLEMLAAIHSEIKRVDAFYQAQCA